MYDKSYKTDSVKNNTLLFIKNMNENSKINVIIKIAMSNDEKHNKNSIITIIKIGNKTFGKIQKNKRENLLYDARQK